MYLIKAFIGLKSRWWMCASFLHRTEALSEISQNVYSCTSRLKQKWFIKGKSFTDSLLLLISIRSWISRLRAWKTSRSILPKLHRRVWPLSSNWYFINKSHRNQRESSPHHPQHNEPLKRLRTSHEKWIKVYLFLLTIKKASQHKERHYPKEYFSTESPAR